MKVKRRNEVVIRMEPWEAQALREEITRVVTVIARDSSVAYPLALYDFGAELLEVEQ